MTWAWIRRNSVQDGRRDTAEREVLVAVCSVRAPTGSSISWATTGRILSPWRSSSGALEVLLEPLRVPGTCAHGKRPGATRDENPLAAGAQLLDPVGEHPPAG
jgi:hypothetical protein